MIRRPPRTKRTYTRFPYTTRVRASTMASPAKFGRYTEGTLSSHDQVARALGTEILAGVYPPGSKIPGESEILHRFGVSRTVLREVLKTLTAKGLIVSKTRVGTTVLDSSHWNFFDADVLSWKVSQGFDAHFRHDLTQVRLALEPAAAAEAAERRSDEDVADLRRCIAQMWDARAEEQPDEIQSL